MPNIDLSKLQLHELEELQYDIEDHIRRTKRELWKSKTPTREELINMFSQFGFVVPADTKIWKVAPIGDKSGGYGMEIGRVEHTCHVDDTTFVVLLIVRELDNKESHCVEMIADHWLLAPVVI